MFYRLKQSKNDAFIYCLEPSVDTFLEPPSSRKEDALPANAKQARTSANGEVVKTYRKAVFQSSEGTFVYKTFQLIRKPKTPGQRAKTGTSTGTGAAADAPASLVPRGSDQKKSMLTLEERVRVRLASARALDEEFQHRREVRHQRIRSPTISQS